MHCFFQIELWPLVIGHCQNFVSAEYLVKESIEFDQILHMH